MFPCRKFGLDLVFWVNLLRWPLSEVMEGQMQKVEEEDTSPLSEMELWSVLSLSRAKRPSAAKMTASFYAFGSDKLYHPFYVKFICTWSQNKSFLLWCPNEELQGLIRLHRGPFLYLSPGMAHSYWGPGAGPLPPGPCQTPENCVCLKTRLNPPQQLSQIRSQLREAAEAQRAAGADCKADVDVAESMAMLRVKKSGVSRLGKMSLEEERKYMSV